MLLCASKKSMQKGTVPVKDLRLWFAMSSNKARNKFLQFDYVSCLWSAVSVGDFEFYFLTFVKSFESVALDCREVYEYVFAAFYGKETITFFCVKPFNCTFQMNNLLKISPSMVNIVIILQEKPFGNWKVETCKGFPA